MTEGTKVDTITEARANAETIIIELKAVSGNVTDTLERLKSPICYDLGMKITSSLGSPANVRWMQTQLFREESIENARRVRNHIELDKPGCSLYQVFLRKNQMFTDNSEFLKLCVKDALGRVDPKDVEAFNELRKDVYRLVALTYSSSYAEMSEQVFTNVKPSEYETGEWLLDDDLYATASKAIDDNCRCARERWTDISQLNNCVQVWEGMSNMLLNTIEHFIKVKVGE